MGFGFESNINKIISDNHIDNDKYFAIPPKQRPENYKKEKHDLPQSFNPDEIEKDKELIARAENKFYESTGKKMAEEGFSEESIEERKIEFIHALLAQNNQKRTDIDVEEVGAMLAEASKRKIDHVTGLLDRGEFFNDMNRELRKVFGFNQDPKVKITDREWADAFKNFDPKKAPEIYAMMSDVSYLGLINDLFGHARGDQLLKIISQKINSEMKIYRYGGDELCGFYKEDGHSLLDKKKLVREQISKVEGLDDLRELSLAPSIDIGYAKLSTAIEVFQKIISNAEANKSEITDVLRSFNDVWLMLADELAYKYKVHDRIYLLVDRANKKLKNPAGIKKGAHGISTRKINEFRAKLGDPKENANKSPEEMEIIKKEIKKDIDLFIREKKLESLKLIKEKQKRMQAETVLQHLNLI